MIFYFYLYWEVVCHGESWGREFRNFTFIMFIAKNEGKTVKFKPEIHEYEEKN